MKFKHTDDWLYLSGERFSSGRAFDFTYEPEDFQYQSRIDVLKRLVTGKQLIHLGCVDEVATIRHRMARGKWLHKELDEVAERCLGVDINEAGVDFINNELGFRDVIVHDVTQPPTDDLAERTWDYFMVPEVLEHIDNPVYFLKKIRQHFETNVSRMIITVPNAFTPENMRNARNGREVINTDHRYWFTPFTLAKVVLGAGYHIENIIMCRHGRVKRRSFIKNRTFKKHPLTRSDIVMVARFVRP